MSIESKKITVHGITVEVIRKSIKNLHLGVYPPDGRVRVAAPLVVSDDAVRLAVVGKIGWIKRQKAKFENQPRQSKREMISGESHYFFGRRYRLRVIEHDGPGRITLRGSSTMELYVRRSTGAEEREKLLQRWSRAELKSMIQPLIEKWQPVMGVQVAAWGVKKMKTKWGSCNPAARRIWLNLELAKKPIHCLEYIVVHEMVHLLVRHHNERFVNVMDKHLPQWRFCREELKQSPLKHDDWNY